MLNNKSIQLFSFSVLISVIYFEVQVRCDLNDQESLKELEIHNLFKPVDCHRKAKVTDVLNVHYTATLEDGEIFDSSYQRNQEFTFQLGLGKVIKGWDKGLIGTCAGEKIKLIVPPHLGYDNVVNEKVPPNSTIIFEIEVLKVEDGPIPANIFKEIDLNGDQVISKKEMIDYIKKHQEDSKNLGDTGSLSDPEQLEMIEEIFMHEDVDKDGQISFEEFLGPKHDHEEL